VRSRLRIR